LVDHRNAEEAKISFLNSGLRMMPGQKPLFRHTPPTAVMVTGSDLWHGLTASVNQDHALEKFRAALIEKTGNPNCFLVSSGRAALALILESLKHLSRRTKVGIPAYVCPTVVQSVLKAGLEPVCCDVDPQTLNLDPVALSRFIDEDLLAVVPAHLYGWAQDLRDIVSLGQQYDFFVIEDAAQAYGAKFCGRMVGNLANAGFYSLGRGKCIPVGHGGIIVSDDKCANVISGVIQNSAIKPPKLDLTTLMLYLGSGIATHPSGWWFVARSHWNPADAGMDAETLPPISLHGLSGTQSGIGSSILARQEQIQSVRRRNADRLVALLAGFEFIQIPAIAPDSAPVFLRFPFVVQDEQRANRLFEDLSGSGIGVSRSYWRTIPELFPGLFPSNGKDFPGASRLARCLLTIPTHAYLNDHDFDRILGVLRNFR